MQFSVLNIKRVAALIASKGEHTPSAPPSGISTSAVMLWARLITLIVALPGTVWVPGYKSSGRRGVQVGAEV